MEASAKGERPNRKRKRTFFLLLDLKKMERFEMFFLMFASSHDGGVKVLADIPVNYANIVFDVLLLFSKDLKI